MFSFLAETVAGLPLHLYRYTGNGDAKEKALDHPLYKILYRKPNPEMTSFTFRETMMTHLLLWATPMRRSSGMGRTPYWGCIHCSRKMWR